MFNDVAEKVKKEFKKFIHTEGLAREELNHMTLSTPLSDYLLPAAYDERIPCYLCRDDSVGFIFECFPKPLAGKDTVSTLQGLFSSSYLPENSSIQITLWASDYIEPFLRQFESMRGRFDEDEKIKTWIDSMTNFYLSQKNQGTSPEIPVPIRNFRLFFSFKLPYGISQYEEKLKDIEMAYRSIRSNLEVSYFFPEPMIPEQYLKMVYLMLNPGHSRKHMPTYDPNNYIYKQAVYADAETSVMKRYLKYDNYYGRALTIKQYPEEVSIIDGLMLFIGDVMKNEMQITCPFIFNITIYKEGDKLRRAQENKAEFLYKQKLASSLSVKLEKKQDEARWVIEKLVEGNQLVKGFLTWWLYHEDKDSLDKSAQVVKALLEVKNYRLQEEIRTMNLAMLMYGSLPMNYSYEVDIIAKRGKTMFDFNAAHLSPVQSDWKGTGMPALLLKSRRGQLQSINFFDGSEGFNAIIAAQTGSGKSFITQHIIYSYYTMPNVSNIWIIDVGESYKLMCEVMGGMYLDFREDANFVINPFSYCDDVNEDMDLFISLVSKMAKPTEAITDTEKAVIEEAITRAFSLYGNKTNIDRIIEVLNEVSESAQEYPKKHAAETIATNLFRWGTNGAYGRYFNGQNNVDLLHKLVVLELKNLNQREDLRNVVLMVLFYHISKIIYIDDDRTKRKMLIFDEAWQFFDDPKIAKFIEKGYRTFRKHGSSAITITQSINDFYKNESTREMMFQASYWLLLKQKAESINLLRKEDRIALSDYEFEVLESIRTIKGKYSEIFFITPLGRGVGRLFVPKELYWIYTSDPTDLGRRTELIDKYGFKEGIEKCIEMYA